ncbi:uncharacterized protein [Ptychodera flava]|uniref:uncharacterized protein n=1 Tax=Ptychodera flava TaxID=63121 RepID=UPI003969EDC4
MVGDFILFLVVLSVKDVFGQDVRLGDKYSPYEGTVEVYLKDINSWARICDDGNYWSMTEADVICRNLGHKTGAMWDLSRSDGSDWPGKWVGNLTCTDDSVTIFHCSYEIMDICTSKRSAGISCNFAGYRGCYIDPQEEPVLPTKLTDGANMTVQACLKSCRDGGFLLAGVENGTECYCGDDVKAVKKSGNQHCATKCGGEKYQSCGGQDPSSSSKYIGVYEVSIGACGGNVIGDHGTIYSPGFPGFYTSPVKCEWIIDSPDNFSISVKFDMFNLQSENDYIEIRNGDDKNSTLLRKYTKLDNVQDDVIDTSSNKMLVSFVSSGEGDMTPSGTFSMEYKALVHCFYNNTGMAEKNNETQVAGGQMLYVKCVDGYILTTNYTNVTCQEDGSWNRVVPKCAKIHVVHVPENTHKTVGIVLMAIVAVAIFGIIGLIIYQRSSKNRKKENNNDYIDDGETGRTQHNAPSDKYQRVTDRHVDEEPELYWDDYANVDQSKNLNPTRGKPFTPMHPIIPPKETINTNLGTGAHGWKEEDNWFEENPLHSRELSQQQQPTAASGNRDHSESVNPESAVNDDVFYDGKTGAEGIFHDKTGVEGGDDGLSGEKSPCKPLTEREKSSYYSLLGAQEKHPDSEEEPLC